jgi:outer membrane protein assembly factor BamB
MRAILLITALLCLPAISFCADNEGIGDLVGAWGGTASWSGYTSRFALEFKQNDKGDVIVSFDLPETNVMHVTVGKVIKELDAFRVWKFVFQLQQDRNVMTGSCDFGGRNITFALKKNVLISGPSVLSPARKMGKPVWIFDAKAPVWGSPAVSKNVVFFGSNDGTLYALGADSGNVLWQFKTGGAIVARPTLHGSSLYVPSDDGHLYKLKEESGQLQWQFDMGGSDIKRAFPNGKDAVYDYYASSATISDGLVYVGSANGKLFALDEESGTRRWEYQTKDMVRSTPVIAEGLVFFGSRDHCVYALSAKSGALRWKYDTGEIVVSSPVYNRGLIFIGSRSSDIFALEAANGKVRWRFFYWLSWVESSGVIRDDVLYVGSSDYQLLFALNTKTGRPIWSFDTDGSAWSTPAVSKDAVFIGAAGTVGYMADHRGGFFAVNRKDGKEKWRFVFDSIPGAFAYGVASSPVVADDKVFFGSIDGKFYAFKTEG